MLKLYNLSVRRPVSLILRSRSSSKREISPKERRMVEKLRSQFPTAMNIEVIDISGGCGDMYEIVVTSTDFKGLNILKQHRLVNEALKNELQNVHGVRIHTSVP